MPALNYYGVAAAIKAILDADPTLNPLGTGEKYPCVIEEDFSAEQDVGPNIFIYLDQRSAPDNRQALAAGQTTRFLVYFSIWIKAVQIDSFRKASELRDNVLGLVEAALMRSRTLGGTVDMFWLGGGQFITARQRTGGNFMAAGEITLVAQAMSSTT